MFAKCLSLMLTLGMVIAHEIKVPLIAEDAVGESNEKSRVSRVLTETEIGRNPQPELVYSFVLPDYNWPSIVARQSALDDGSFIPTNNIITGIKVWNNEEYVTVPRLLTGVPATLCKVFQFGPTAQPILQAFPNWQWQSIGDCRFLQFVQSMEIDPNTGYMWIIDTGRISFRSPGATRNLCPPKLIIYDLSSGTEVGRHIFPPDVASPVGSFLNDIVLDYVGGRVGFAYITDTTHDGLGPGIIIYNAQRNSSHRVYHESMTALGPVDGIAMSPDFRFLYYATVTTEPIYQVPTAILRQPNVNISAHVRNIGNRMSMQTDGMIHSKTSLYYGNMAANGVSRWDVSGDVIGQSVDLGRVNMTRQTLLVHDDIRMRWADTFAIDEAGYLWFVANNLMAFFRGEISPSGNFFVWKLNINEMSYLDQRAVVSTTPDIIG